MAKMRFERWIEFSAPPDRVWALLADTDRLNREMGFPVPSFSYQARSNGGTDVVASASLGPMRFRYREHPFEWVRGRFYSIRRTFGGGPIAEVVGKVQFEAIGNKTRVKVTTEVECRSFLLLGRMFGLRSLAQLEAACRGFEAYLSKAASTPYPKESGRPPADLARLEQGRGSLQRFEADQDVCGKLCDFLRTAPAGDLVNFRPLELAVRLGVEPQALLIACLAATKVGLTDMSWRVMCPYCRSNKDTVRKLEDLGQEAHCEACNIRFGAGFDENVEVVFSVSHNVRPVVYGAYCIGGPQLAPQAVAQWVLEPGGSRTETLELGPNVWQVTSLQASNRLRLFVSPDGAGECRVRFRDGAAEADAETIAGQVCLTLSNETSDRVIVRLEEADWRARAVSAAQVTSLQAFRDQFSSEVLAPGVEIGVGQVCILFTDLKGSTRMYREQGDALSYATVREHFTRLRRSIAAHEGAVVKTIGDAIMASFNDPGNAVRAALEIQSADDPLVTKIGLHWGPAIVVNANDILDYFGRTVNLASRLQKHSLGGDVILAAELALEPGVRQAISDFNPNIREFCAEVPDIETEMKLVRLTPR